MQSPPLTITFLGTGTSGGVPMVACDCRVCQSTDTRDKRLRSSIMVESPNTRIIVDATPDFRQQLLREQVKHVDALLITHAHKDHIGGIDDTRALQYAQQAPTQIYGNAHSLQGVRQEVPYAFAERRYPGVPELELHEIGEHPFRIGDIPILPVQVWHHKMPVLAFRFGNFAYITDANRIDDEEFEKLHGINALVVNALRREPHISHFTLSQATKLAQSTTARQSWFTHISHQMGLHAEVNSKLPAGIALAWDGLKISV